MSTTRVAVLHREGMVGEALASALSRHPGIVAHAVSAPAQLAWAPALDAVAVDTYLPAAAEVTRQLRDAGVSVVMIGPEPMGDAPAVPSDLSVAALARALSPKSEPLEDATTRLSPRELEVLSLAARGLAGKQIARELGISPKTVEQHKTRSFAKLGVPNQAAAIAVLGATQRGVWWNRSAI